MFEFNTYVKANEIWPKSKTHIDLGLKTGFVRGYCIEVKTKDGVDWLSCEYIHGEPQKHFNDEFHLWYYEEHGWTPTGRISFRGYAVEAWDYEIGDYVEDVEFPHETLEFLKSQLSNEDLTRLDKYTTIMLENDDYINYDIDVLCISYILQNFNVEVHK